MNVFVCKFCDIQIICQDDAIGVQFNGQIRLICATLDEGTNFMIEDRETNETLTAWGYLRRVLCAKCCAIIGVTNGRLLMLRGENLRLISGN